MCIAEEKMSAGLAELGTNTQHFHSIGNIGNTIFIHLVVVMECQEGRKPHHLREFRFVLEIHDSWSLLDSIRLHEQQSRPPRLRFTTPVHHYRSNRALRLLVVHICLTVGNIGVQEVNAARENKIAENRGIRISGLFLLQQAIHVLRVLHKRLEALSELRLHLHMHSIIIPLPTAILVNDRLQRRSKLLLLEGINCVWHILLLLYFHRLLHLRSKPDHTLTSRNAP